MASSPQFVVKAHFNGETYMCPTVGFLFRNTDNVRFLLNGKANFSYFKKRLEAKLERGPVSQIFYQSPVFFGNNQVIFYKVEIQDDEDFQNMISNHVYSGNDSIELYVLFQELVMSLAQGQQ